MTDGGCADEITLAIPASLVRRKSGFSIDFGGSFIKVAYATDEGDKVKLHFCSYPVDKMEQAFREIASRQIVAGEHQKVYTCGLGCNEHQAFIERTLGCRILNILEIDCFIDGFRFLTENFPLADVTYPQSESVIQYAEKMAKRLATQHLLLSTKFKDTCRAKMWQSSKRIFSEEQSSRDRCKNSYAGQTPGRVDQVQYPIILGLCGSATQVVKVEEDGSYTFVNLISASGKTIEALSSLITGVKSFEELVSLAETGCLHNVSTIGSKMNLDNDDVYGALSHGTLVFDLGRAVGKDAREFRREDLSLGIISLIIQMLVTSVHDWSLISDVTQVYFSGGLYQSPLIREMMGKYYEYKSNMNPLGKETRHYFLKHGMYIGAIGALVKTLNSPPCTI